MIELPEDVKARLWAEVREEFPHDEMMAEIHFVRAMHCYLMEQRPEEEWSQFYEEIAGNASTKAESI